MKKYLREVLLGIMLIIIFAGLVLWFTKHEPEATLKIVIAGLSILIGTAVFIWNVFKKKKDAEVGAPAEDEFTKLATLYAGQRAFFLSMYLWFFIFIFNYKFTNNEEMLGIGIMGSALIYGICLWYYKSTAGFDEK